MDIGDIFGRLKVLQFLPESKVLVQCECGSTKEVRKGHLKDGNTTSCITSPSIHTNALPRPRYQA